MSSRSKIVIVIIVLVLVVGIGTGFFLWKSRLGSLEGTSSQNGSTSADAQSVGGVAFSSGSSGNGAVRSENPDQYAFARSFVERYGSYSNQSNFENMEDLYPFMTDRMKTATAAFVKSQRDKGAGGASYQGTTTHALSARTLEEGSERAVLSIASQRQESNAEMPSGRVYYQTIELVLIKDGASWRVDEANWK